MNPLALPVLIVTGPVGAGKTTVAAAISAELERREVAHAWVDVDQLAQCFPRPAGDPFHGRLVVRNLADVCRNFVAAGAERLILPYVIEDVAGRAAIASAIPGGALTVVRLTVRPETVAARLRGRESDESLAWHLRRAPELTAIMESNRVGDIVLATDGRTPKDLALEIMGLVGWQGIDS